MDGQHLPFPGAYAAAIYSAAGHPIGQAVHLACDCADGLASYSSASYFGCRSGATGPEMLAQGHSRGRLAMRRLIKSNR